MASIQNDIELRHPPGVARTQQSHTFPSGWSSPSDLTHTLPVGNVKSHHRAPSATWRPNDDETTMDAPLLSSQAMTPGSISRENQSYEFDRKRISDQSGSPVEHTLCPGTRDNQQATTSTLLCADRDTRVPKHITRSSWTRHLNAWFVHVPAILMTVAILCVGSLRFYWYPEEGPLLTNYRVDADIINNVFQLVAKLHELVIVASLSSIALAMFRRCLVTSGVRLGFLTGGYRVGDLGYIGTAAFWRQGVDISSPVGMLLPGFVVFATIMSTIVGPASAVLLVPTIGWYEMENPAAFGRIKLPLLYSWNRTNVWYPGRHEAADECKTVEGIYKDYCPAGGFPEISSWLRDFAATDLTNNLTFHSTSADLRRHLVFTQVNNTQNTSLTTLCTTPLHFLTTSIGLFQKYIDHADVGALSSEPRYRLQTRERDPDSPQQDVSTLYQPFVQSKCTIYEKDELKKDPQPVFYPVDSLNCFHDEDCRRFQREPKMFKEGWLTDPKFDTDVSIASNFLVNKSNSAIVFINGQIPDASLGESKHMVFLCSLIASWAPSNFSVDAKVSDVLQTSLSNDNAMQELYLNQSTDGIHTLRFSDPWFKALNPRWNVTNTTSVTALQQIVQNFSSKEKQNGTTLPVMAPVSRENTTAAELFLGKVFGVYFTEGLARSTFQHQKTRVVLNKSRTELAYINLNEQHGFRGGVHKLTYLNSTFYRENWRGKDTDINGTLEGFEKSLQTNLPIYLVAERHGYGSGQQRRTLKWAQAMMCIYLGTVAIYALAVGVMSVLEFFEYEPGGVRIRVLSIKPWSDLQDLMILALKTPVPNDVDLADAGAGVTSSRVWEKTVRAAADDESNAQLVLEETKDARRLDLDGRVRYY